MKKFLMLLVFSVMVLGVCPAASAQDEHGGQTAESQPGEHAAEAEHHEESPLQTVFKWVNFLVLFGGLAFLLRKPITEFFAQRRNDIGSGLQRAEEAQAAAHNRMDEIEQRLAAVSAEVAALKTQAEKEAVNTRDKILAEAKREVVRIVEQSRQEIDRVARTIERQIKENVADMVIDRAGETLRMQMTEDDQKRVVVRFIKKL